MLEQREAQLDRVTRQLREANARLERAFEQGAAMVIQALRNGADLEDVARKVRWEHVHVSVPRMARGTAPQFEDEEPTIPNIPLVP